MIKNKLFAKAVNTASAVAIFCTPIVADAQFGNLLKDLKSVEDALKGLPNSAAPTQQSNNQIQQEAVLKNILKSEEVSQAPIAQDLASGLQPGYYKKGSDVTLYIKNSGKDINFLLSIGHIKGKNECTDTYVDCVSIDGAMKENPTGTYIFKDNEVGCSFKALYKNNIITLSNSDGDCGTGSFNRQQLKFMNGEYKFTASSTQSPASNQSGAGLSANQFGYLTGQIKTYEGAGCTYYRKDDEKKKAPKFFAADDYNGKGVIININGKDVLFKEKSRNMGKNYQILNLVYENNGMWLVIKYGTSKSCGEECSKNMNLFKISKGDQEISIPTYSICGS